MFAIVDIDTATTYGYVVGSVREAIAECVQIYRATGIQVTFLNCSDDDDEN